MDGLPKDVNLNVLVGREISMVRIGKFQLHYFLTDDNSKPSTWIEIESSDVTVTAPKHKAEKVDSFPKAGGVLSSLVGLVIEKANRRDDGGLTLELAGGVRLDVGVHSSKYESIVLHIGPDSIVG